jgi:hypothetical protein
MESNYIVIESFEENKSEQDDYNYGWYDFKKDNNVPENVFNELREHVTELNYEVRQNGKIYKCVNKPRPTCFSGQQIKEYMLENLEIESTEIKQQIVNKRVKEASPIINIIRNLAISHEPVKWENLPVTGRFRESYTNKNNDFKITKLWASAMSVGFIDDKKDDNSIKLYIIIEPSVREKVHHHYIGKIQVTQNGKKCKKYCEHCEIFNFSSDSNIY